MMRTPNAYAIAVRKPDGTIVNTAARLPKWSDKYPILKLPVLRGGAVLVQSMGLGIKALNYSANEAFAELEEAKTEEVKVALSPAVIEGEGDFAGLTGAVPGLFPVPTQKRSQDELKKGQTAAAAGSIIFALIFNVLLFCSGAVVVDERVVHRGWLGHCDSRRNKHRSGGFNRHFESCRLVEPGRGSGAAVRRRVVNARVS